MSEDWPRGWYQNETAAGSPSASDPTRDMTFAAPPSGRAGAPGAGAPGAGGPGAGGMPGRGGGGWPEQPPQRSEYENGSSRGRGASGLRRDGDYGQPGSFRRALGRLLPPGRRGRRIALIAGLLVIVLVVALAGSYFWIDGKLNRSVALPAFAGQSAGQNWLIAGSDSRQGLSRTQIDALHVGFDSGTLNSDSLMLLHMGSGRPVLVSIPRDSYVPIPGHGENKINAALAFGGPTLLIKTVEEVTGLRIDHYMGIGFAGLVSVVNTVGGVRICLPAAIHDSYSGVNLSAGCHNLNGTQALAFVRDRHSFTTSDLQRIQDQRAFLKALLNKATSPGVYLNPFVALPFASTAAGSISVDKGTNLYDLTQAARALRNPLTGTVPISDPSYFTSNAGEAVLWNHPQAVALFNALQKDKPVPSGLLGGTKVG